MEFSMKGQKGKLSFMRFKNICRAITGELHFISVVKHESAAIILKTWYNGTRTRKCNNLEI